MAKITEAQGDEGCRTAGAAPPRLDCTSSSEIKGLATRSSVWRAARRSIRTWPHWVVWWWNRRRRVVAIDQKYGKLDISKIGEDEPIFVLRARDSLAVRLLREYQALCVRVGASAEHREKIGQCLDAFLVWRSTNPVKIPN